MSSKVIAPSAEDIKRQVSPRQVFRDECPNEYREHGNVLCPFHSDSNESLQINDRGYYCHAEKKAFDIFDLVGIKHGITDFNEKRRYLCQRYRVTGSAGPKPKRKWIASYEYVDEKGNVVLVVDRYEPKTFRQRRPDPNSPDKWIYNVKGVRLVPYNLTKVIEAESVWVCEGEKDADNLSHLGFCATTNVQGAQKWKRQCDEHGIHEWFKGKNTVICPDNDQPGRDHAQQIADSLRGIVTSVKILSLPGLDEKQDVSDFIALHGDNARQELLKILQATPEYKQPRSLSNIISFPDLMSMDLPDPRMVIHDILPEGLCILAGAPKIGKSWLVHDLSLAVACGHLALGMFQCSQGAVLHLALEDSLRRFRKRMGLLLGPAEAPETGMFACEWPRIGHEVKGKGADGLDLIQHWLEDHHETARLVVIDTLSKIRPSKPSNKTVYERDYEDLEGLHQLASSYGVAIILVHHLNKGKHDDAFNSVSGSTGLTGAADSVWLLEKARGETGGTLFVSGRDIEERKGSLSFDKANGQWKWLGDVAELKMSEGRRDIRDTIRDNGRPMTITEVVEATGKTYEATKKTVYRMLEKGELVKSVGNRGRFTLPAEDALYGNNSKPEPETDPVQEEIHLDHI